jgi:large subunit ribosomal protein L1
MKKRSKRYQTTEKLVNKDKVYTLKEAVNLLKSLAQPKFAGSLDLHFNLNVDTKKSDQMIRGTVVLPHGTGRKVKIAVFCKGEQERDARDAQADYVGAGDLMEKVAAGFLDFDCVIATPDMMKDLSKLGKILGPKGLLPSHHCRRQSHRGRAQGECGVPRGQAGRYTSLGWEAIVQRRAASGERELRDRRDK